MALWLLVVINVIVLAAITLLMLYFIRKRNKSKGLNYTVEQLSGEMAERIIYSIPDMIFLVDNNYKILKVFNSSPEKLSIPVENILGMSLHDCVDIEYTIPVLKGVQNALISDEVQEVEYTVSVGGKTTHFEGRFKRVEKDLVACFERNITERKKAEEAIRQNEILLSQVLDNMPMPVIIKDINNDLRYTFWNKECEKGLGYAREDVIGKTDIELYGQEKGSIFHNLDKQVIASGKSYHEQGNLIVPDGKKYSSIVNKNIISNNIHKWLITTRWDISELIRYQDQLKEANQQLQIAFSVTSSVPVIWDLEADIISFKFTEFKQENDGFFQDRNGLSSGEVISYLHPDDRERIAPVFDDIRNGRIETLHEELRYDIHGKYDSYYEVYLTIERYSITGKPLRIVGTMRNITEQKLYEQSIVEAKKSIEEIQRNNQIILDNSNSGLIYIDPDYIVQWENVSDKATDEYLTKYKTGVCCYKTVRGMSAPCEECVAKKAFQSKEIEKIEVDFGNEFVSAMTATPVLDNDGNASGVVIKIDDISQQRKAEEELRRAKEAAETSDKLKSMFISNMSHEIRTPLNAIVGFSELLIHTSDIEEKEEYMSVIKRNNELLLQLINDILDLSKIEADTLEFVYSNVDINDMFRNMDLSTHQKVGEIPDLQIVFAPELENCVIYTEKNRIQQVILNFINNALKFTEKGEIRVGYKVEGEDGIRFYVSDTGKGIPKDKQADIFKRFVKLDNFVNGTGLGLSICQTIISKLKGEIGVDSEEGVGSTFWFTLPVKPIINEAKKENSGNAAADTNKKLSVTITNRDLQKEKATLLIAEDTVDNFRLYKTLLDKKYDLIHAWNGVEAIDLYKQNKERIDAIIMDIKMPEMDGYEASRLIREEDNDVYIIAASAYAFSEDVAKIMSSGFNDYISKPLNRNILFSALQNAGL